MGTEEWDAEVEDGGGLSCGVSEHALCHQAAHVIASCSSLSLARFPAPRIICCLAASCGQDRGMHSGSHSCPARIRIIFIVFRTPGVQRGLVFQGSLAVLFALV